MSYPPQPPQQPPQPPQPGQYPQQPQYQQPPYGQYQQAPVAAQNSTLALTAFIMALASWVLVWIPKIGIIGWLLNLTAFILGIVANGQIKKSAGALSGKGFAVTAIVLSCVLFGLFLLLVIVIGAAIGSLLGSL